MAKLTMDLKLKLTPEAEEMHRELLGLMDEPEALETFKQVVELFLDLSNLLSKLFRLQVDASAATTRDVLVLLEPTDCFRMLLVALRARDVNCFVIEKTHG